MRRIFPFAFRHGLFTLLVMRTARQNVASKLHMLPALGIAMILSFALLFAAPVRAGILLLPTQAHSCCCEKESSSHKPVKTASCGCSTCPAATQSISLNTASVTANHNDLPNDSLTWIVKNESAPLLVNAPPTPPPRGIA